MAINLDDFPFVDILEASSSEEELLANVENYFEKPHGRTEPDEGLVIESSQISRSNQVKQVMGIYVKLGKFSKESYDSIFMTRKLKARWSVEAAQDLKSVHDIGMVDELLADELCESIQEGIYKKQFQKLEDAGLEPQEVKIDMLPTDDFDKIINETIEAKKRAEKSKLCFK